MKIILPKTLRLLWAVLGTLLFPYWICDSTLGFSNSLFSIVLLTVLFLLLEWEAKQGTDRRRTVFTHAAGLIFSAFTTSGYSLGATGSALPHPWFQVPALLVFTHILATAVSALWRILERVDRTEKRETGFLAARSWIIPVILLICWFPAFLAEYPGGFRYDATMELNQIIPGKIGFIGDFPALHSAIVTFLLPQIYKITGDYDTGLTVYIVIQILLMAAMYTHMLRTLIRKGVNRWVIRYALAYCALFPVIQILVTQEVRDVMFAALFTYSVFILYLLSTETEQVLGGKVRPVLYAVVLSLTMLARNNNAGTFFLAAVILVSVVIWLLNRKKYLRGATIWLVSGIGSFLLISWVTGIMCQPVKSTPTAGASLSAFSQSITRAFVTRGDSWTEEERAELSEYMDLENIRYVPDYGDATKNRIWPEADIGKYKAFCLKMGLKYPGVYMNALLAQTREMWFPASVVDGYKHYFTEDGQPYSGYEKNYYAINDEHDLPIRHDNLLPGLLNFYTDIGLRISFEKVPVVSMWFSIGAQTWLVLCLFLYLWYRKKRMLLVPAGAILLYLIGNAFVPIVLLRYFAAVFLCHPMIAVFLLQPGKSEELMPPEPGKARKKESERKSVMRETINRRVINPVTRDRWISIAYMIFACAMLLHHIYVTVYFAAPENGAPVFWIPWLILALVSIVLGRMWKDKCFWILTTLLMLKFLRVALPMPRYIGYTQTAYELCLYAFVDCYAVGRVLCPGDRKRFISLFCGIWTASVTVMACIGLYTVWNNAVIPNLGTKVFRVEDSRLWPIYHPVEGGSLASLTIAMALIGIWLTKRKPVKALYITAAFLIFLMGIFTNSRTNNIMNAVTFSMLVCMFAYEWRNTGAKDKKQTVLRIAGVCVLFAVLSLGLIVLQTKMMPLYNAIRGQGGTLISTAYAEEAAGGVAQMNTRGFVLNNGLNGFLVGRVHIWERVLEALKDKPILLLKGNSLYKFMKPLNEYGLGDFYHLHSTFIQTLWESGIPGLLLFVSFFGIFAVNAFRLITDRKAPLWVRLIPMPAILCWMADFIDCTGYCNFGKPAMTILYLFSGLTIAIARENRKKEQNNHA